MNDANSELEAKLLEILDQPDIVQEMTDAVERCNDGDEESLTEHQRATLNTLLEAGLPSPEDIAIRAECAEHNAKIQAQREVRLAARRERRQARGKNKKRKKR